MQGERGKLENSRRHSLPQVFQWKLSDAWKWIETGKKKREAVGHGGHRIYTPCFSFLLSLGAWGEGDRRGGQGKGQRQAGNQQIRNFTKLFKTTQMT